MKGKKIHYILIFNLILFIGLIFNFYIKSETGNGMFHGISTWWSEVNTVKDNSQIKLMSATSNDIEDPLEKIGKHSIESIQIEQPIVESIVVVESVETPVVDNNPKEEVKKEKIEVKDSKSEKVKKEEKVTPSEPEVKSKKDESKSSNFIVSQSFNINDNSEISDKTAFITLQKNDTPLCVNYGPLNIEQKSSFNILLSKYNVPDSLVKKTEDDLYEIFWNLGNNKEVAIELFEKQKNEGALQDVRFKLKQDNSGNYIVPISTVAGNLSMANKMTQDLKNSSKNIGGIWEYRAIEKGYFYQISDIRKLDSELVNSINQVIDTLKTTCN